MRERLLLAPHQRRLLARTGLAISRAPCRTIAHCSFHSVLLSDVAGGAIRFNHLDGTLIEVPFLFNPPCTAEGILDQTTGTGLDGCVELLAENSHGNNSYQSLTGGCSSFQTQP